MKTNFKTYKRPDGTDGIINDAKAVAFQNSALPGVFNSEEALDTMILNINSAIVESGSNEKGSYIKYADGTMIQRSNYTGITNITHTINFPVQFIDTNVYVSCGVYTSDPSSVKYSIYELEVTRMQAIIQHSQSVTRTIHWLAIGRWKAPSAEPYKPVLPEFPSDIVTYTNDLYTELKNTKQALDLALGKFGYINKTDLLNGWTNNGTSFWAVHGKEVHVHLNIRNGTTGVNGTVLCYIPFLINSSSFVYNIGGKGANVLINGAISLAADGNNSKVYILAEVSESIAASINVDLFGLLK